MKKIACLAMMIVILFQAKSQVLTANPATVDFGVVNEITPDSVWVWIKNTTVEEINILSVVRIDDNYGNMPFSVSPAVFSVLPLDSTGVWIKFKPVHNVKHESEIVFINNSGRGAVRVDVKGQGRFSNSYYNSTENLEEAQLRTALKTKISTGTTDLGYNGARDEMFMVIDNQKVNGQGATSNTVECVYTGRKAVGYTTRAEAQNQSFNTEHTFPQSLFNSATPMLSDLFHLYPTDDAANNTRGNLPFGDITGSTTWSNGGSTCNGNKFEPRDAQKGRSARSMLYFVIRYQDYSCYEQNQEAVLRQWHTQFPPNTVEKNRNSVIFGMQHNRNPFIDYPQLVQRISVISSCSPSNGTKDLSILAAEDSANYGNVKINVPTHYSFVAINDGEDSVKIQNIQSGSPFITFGSQSNQDVTVGPGEAIMFDLQLELASLGTFVSDFQFSTNIPASNPIIIPVTANGVNTIDVNEAFKQHISIYPNPASQVVRLDNTNLSSCEVQMYDYVGKAVTEKMPLDTHLEIPVSHLAKGVYMISITQNHHKMVEKIIIE